LRIKDLSLVPNKKICLFALCLFQRKSAKFDGAASRAAWQAVSDYIHDPKAIADYARTALERLHVRNNVQFGNERKLLDRAGAMDRHASDV
jgi:hypothetical protein